MTTGPAVAAAGRDAERPPLYARLLRLRHLALRRWHAAVLFDGVVVVSVVLALAELASAWTPVLLPAAVALVVKLNDVVAGLTGPLPGREPPPRPPHRE